MVKKGKVRNNKKNVNSVRNTINPITPNNSSITFDFSYKNWLATVSFKDFSNRLFNESQYSQFMYEIFSVLIPTVHENWNEIKKNTKVIFPNCHTIAKEKIGLVEEIIELTHGKKLLDESLLEDSDDSYNYWQLGVKQSVRLIGIYSNSRNIMYPVFVDYHHQIHIDPWFNGKDLEKYPFCPKLEYN